MWCGDEWGCRAPSSSGCVYWPATVGMLWTAGTASGRRVEVLSVTPAYSVYDACSDLVLTLQVAVHCCLWRQIGRQHQAAVQGPRSGQQLDGVQGMEMEVHIGGLHYV